MRARLAADGREADRDGAALADGAEHVGHADVLERLGALEVAVRASALGVDDTLRDALAVKVREQVDQADAMSARRSRWVHALEVLQEERAGRAGTLDLVTATCQIADRECASRTGATRARRWRPCRRHPARSHCGRSGSRGGSVRSAEAGRIERRALPVNLASGLSDETPALPSGAMLDAMREVDAGARVSVTLGQAVRSSRRRAVQRSAGQEGQVQRARCGTTQGGRDRPGSAQPASPVAHRRSLAASEAVGEGSGRTACEKRGCERCSMRERSNRRMTASR